MLNGESDFFLRADIFSFGVNILLVFQLIFNNAFRKDTRIPHTHTTVWSKKKEKIQVEITNTAFFLLYVI